MGEDRDVEKSKKSIQFGSWDKGNYHKIKKYRMENLQSKRRKLGVVNGM